MGNLVDSSSLDFYLKHNIKFLHEWYEFIKSSDRVKKDSIRDLMLKISVFNSKHQFVTLTGNIGKQKVILLESLKLIDELNKVLTNEIVENGFK